LGRRARFKPLAWLCAAYVEGLRGTPLLVQIIFIYYALPQLLGVDLAPMLAAVLALTLNSAAYVAEIFRAGIASVDPGQSEAARALGMSPAQSMRYVILPQALRNVLPPLTNEGIALLKDSSLVSIIGMAELTRAGQEMASQFAAPLAIWPAVAVFYLLATLPLTRLAAALERRLQRQH
ncbi:amino acid ABC transporter permease, partial [Pyxidicoccus sp. 3LG]